MAKQESKKKYVLAVVIVLLLALAVGYAAFSDILTITGTANVAQNADFDVHFKETSAVVASVGCTASVSRGADDQGDANDKLTVTVSDLAYPGAGEYIKAVVENSSSVPVKVKQLTTQTNLTGNGGAIKITGLNSIATDSGDTTIAANGGTCEIYFTVEWDSNVTTISAADRAGFTFEVGIEYEQATAVLEVTPKNAVNFVGASS